MKNIIAGYRKMLGLTQEEMASIFGISRQSYGLKESGKTPFNDREKIIFKQLVQEIMPDITIDQIFFR
ncbi:helix-turn-helix transcriptional regulator [Aerococcus suis]